MAEDLEVKIAGQPPDSKLLEPWNRRGEDAESDENSQYPISGTRLIVKFVLAKSSHNHYFRLFKQTSLQFLDLL